MIEQAEVSLKDTFFAFEKTALINQQKVLQAFRDEKVALRHFAPTTGYGYGDEGREKLDALFARVFKAEAAVVGPQIVSGTHAIALALRAVCLLKPHMRLVSGSGKPYDTIEETIGIAGNSPFALSKQGVSYDQIELTQSGLAIEAISRAMEKADVLFLQRSRGYAWRKSLHLEEIEECITAVKKVNPRAIVCIDNCYGEFTQSIEPIEIGADVIAGSLIKNPGGGIAPSGGYISGKKPYINAAEDCLTCPGIGREVGSYAAVYTPFFQGIYMAPHVVCQALKGAALFAKVFELSGLKTMPGSNDNRDDIIQAVELGSREGLLTLCKSIQSCSPVDSFLQPEPWDMPGYQHQVVMAAGTFTQGSSIELSADGPVKEPYIAYIQGGLTYEHCKIAAMEVIKSLLEQKIICL
ncbi:MAG: methionine gamma-lyase family protein [Christensenellales bacterium]